MALSLDGDSASLNMMFVGMSVHTLFLMGMKQVYEWDNLHRRLNLKNVVDVRWFGFEFGFPLLFLYHTYYVFADYSNYDCQGSYLFFCEKSTENVKEEFWLHLLYIIIIYLYSCKASLIFKLHDSSNYRQMRAGSP